MQKIWKDNIRDISMKKKHLCRATKATHLTLARKLKLLLLRLMASSGPEVLSIWDKIINNR